MENNKDMYHEKIKENSADSRKIQRLKQYRQCKWENSENLTQLDSKNPPKNREQIFCVRNNCTETLAFLARNCMATP